MKFTMGLEKKNRANIGQAKGHNKRLHDTASQLPQRAWFGPQGSVELVQWNDAVLERAKQLAKRKDAVIGIELSIAVGRQEEWRDAPTIECPEGKPRADMLKLLPKLKKGVLEAIKAEFGSERIIAADLHLDESTPHVQVIVSTERNGKLDQKHWIGGAEKCAALRERIHAVVNQYVPCTYEKGAPGGQPHDHEKRAGGPAGPQPTSILKRASEAVSVAAENRSLKQRIEDLLKQLAAAFSREKRLMRQLHQEQQKLKEAQLLQQSFERREKESTKRIEAMKLKIELLENKLEAATSKPQSSPAPKPSAPAPGRR